MSCVDLYVGTQEEAVEVIKFWGLNTVTNFMSLYDVKSIIESSSLPVGSTTKRPEDGTDQSDIVVDDICAEAAWPMTHYSKTAKVRWPL
jgi:AP2-like factor, ANT lineage